jgi:hypothetical protein
MTFSRAHFSTIIKYIGISFITGAISHWFFSGTRSLLTGIVWVVAFTIGTLLEEDTTNTSKTIIAGAILAVGIGSLTGGLQHFPDSPERSLWITPLGFLVSIIFFKMVHTYTLKKKDYVYAIIASIVMLISSIGIYILIENYIPATANHHEVTEIVPQNNSGTIQETQKSIEPVQADHHN